MKNENGTDHASSSIQRTVESSEIDDLIGGRIREQRRRLGLSLKQVSASSGLSIGLLSQVERGLSSPSVRTLSLISAELGVSPSWFFDGEQSSSPESSLVLRKHDRKTIDYADGITKEILTHAHASSLELLLVHLKAYASSGEDFYTHPGEEAGYILAGAIKLYVDDEVYLLGEGDTFAFKSTRPHRFENPYKNEAQVLWMLTARTYV